MRSIGGADSAWPVPDGLTEAEGLLFESLARPPRNGSIVCNGLWILEWLPSGERQTGKELHEWANQKRPGWSTHFTCTCKAEVIQGILGARLHCEQSGRVPILHIESHGGHEYLEGPGATGCGEALTWRELTPHLQALITSLRPMVRSNTLLALRERLSQNGLLDAEAERRIRNFKLPPAQALQEVWDKMFMIDLFTPNRERFGLDVQAIADGILEWDRRRNAAGDSNT